MAHAHPKSGSQAEPKANASAGRGSPLAATLDDQVDLLPQPPNAQDQKNIPVPASSGVSAVVTVAASTQTATAITATAGVSSAIVSHGVPSATDVTDDYHVEASNESLQGQGPEGEHEGGRVWEIQALRNHRLNKGEPGKVMLWVEWVGSKIKSWATEDEIQDAAPELLFAYWHNLGGRNAVVFDGPRLPERYWVYDILHHRRSATTGRFEFKVQWLGYSTRDPDTTYESETKLKNVAPQVLRDYWVAAGGREPFIGKPGRPKEKRWT